MSDVSDWLISRTEEVRKSISSLADDVEEMINDAIKTVNSDTGRRRFFEEKYNGNSRRHSNALQNWKRIKRAVRSKKLKVQSGIQNTIDEANKLLRSSDEQKNGDSEQLSGKSLKSLGNSRAEKASNVAERKLPMFESLRKRVETTATESQHEGAKQRKTHRSTNGFIDLIQNTRQKMKKSSIIDESFVTISSQGQCKSKPESDRQRYSQDSSTKARGFCRSLYSIKDDRISGERDGENQEISSEDIVHHHEVNTPHFERLSNLSMQVKSAKDNFSKAWADVGSLRPGSLSVIESVARPGSLNITETFRDVVSRFRSQNDLNSCQTSPNVLLRKEGAKFFPFCADYDGKSFRRTSTISASIQAFIGDNKSSEEDLLQSKVRKIVAELLTSHVHVCTCGAKYESLAIEPEFFRVRGENEDFLAVFEETGTEISNTSVMSGQGSVSDAINISSNRIDIPCEPRTHKDSPHVSRRLSTTLNSLPIEQNYIESKCLTSHMKFQEKSVEAFLQMSIQLLIVTNRLKVTVDRVVNLLSLEKASSGPKLFVKACIMPQNRKKQKRTKKETGLPTTHFREEIYFNDISIEDVHLICLRFQVYQKKPWFSRKTYRCLGEAFLWLDELDVIGKVDVKVNLKPYLS